MADDTKEQISRLFVWYSNASIHALLTKHRKPLNKKTICELLIVCATLVANTGLGAHEQLTGRDKEIEVSRQNTGPVDQLLDFILEAFGSQVTQTQSSPKAGNEAISSVEGDRAALVALYNATDGENWAYNENWLTNAPLGDWYGVTTNASGRVLTLSFYGFSFQTQEGFRGLSGILPAAIGNLTEIQSLYLPNHQISGTIPVEIGNLSKLLYLNLEGNQLSGTIPSEMGELKELRTLNLSTNELEGSIPKELRHLANLRSLDLSWNGLRDRIPTEIGELSNLSNLELHGNDFIGEIPKSLSKLTSLTRLDLYGNNLTGPIPSGIRHLTKLTFLDFSYNRLSGEIPSEIGSLVNLLELHLNNNVLTGSLPPEIGNVMSLDLIDVSSNRLSGRITPQLTKLSALTFLDLSNNNLTGPVISGLRHIPNLTYLFLQNNNFEGPLPARLRDSTEILVFGIAGNDICIPGTQAYINWLRGVVFHDILSRDFCNASDRIALLDLYESTAGENWTRKDGWEQEYDVLRRWQGVEIDSLGRVASLNLADNGLTGKLPLSISELKSLKSLNVSGNDLTGRLPFGLMRLPLTSLQITGTNLCVPPDSLFQNWILNLGTVARTSVACEPLSQRDVLELIYVSTGGDDWLVSTNWNTNTPSSEWQGIEVDEEGHVIAIDLSANNLAGVLPLEFRKLTHVQTMNLADNRLRGTIPPEYGLLRELQVLDLGDNRFSGSIPIEISELKDLTSLDLSNNDLGGSIPQEIGNMVNLEKLNLTGNEISGEIPEELWDLTSLVELHLDLNKLTGQISSKINQLTWLEELDLSGNAIAGFIPNQISQLSNLTHLSLADNDLGGQIPNEIGDLANLIQLDLQDNQLSGQIPAELEGFVRLTEIDLSGNELTGPIPETLGTVTTLTRLDLSENELNDTIPTTLGNLRELAELILRDNSLEGSIPIELRDLDKLNLLDLGSNKLDGVIAEEIGLLQSLDKLYLGHNQLVGTIPPSFGNLANLKEFDLTNNRGLRGEIPPELGNLKQLQSFLTSGTDLCLPKHKAFHDWSLALYKRRLRSCDADGPLLTYMTQATQSHAFPVPLVAGKQSLLRVFPTALKNNTTHAPVVQVRFFLEDTEVHSTAVSAPEGLNESQANEGNLDGSVNVHIPGSIVKPGLEMVIEVEVEESASTVNETVSRIPQEGRIPIEVHEFETFNLTLIPFLWDESSDRSIIELVDAMASDPDGHEMLKETRTLLPIGDLAVHAHPPVISSSNHPYDLLDQTAAIHLIEETAGYSMGTSTTSSGGILGVAFLSAKVSFSIPDGYVIAHELGHNLSLEHAPCGGPSCVDRSFPYDDGSSGTWGFDFQDEGQLVSPSTPDVMSYCTPVWISDYHFTNAFRYRLYDEQYTAEPVSVARQSLLIWGNHRNGEMPSLNPSFIVQAASSMPAWNSAGEYAIVASSNNGDTSFEINFDMHTVTDMENEKSFAFLVPLDSLSGKNIQSLSLIHNGDSTVQFVGSSSAMSIVQNPRTNEVRGFFQHPEGIGIREASEIKKSLNDKGLELLISHGLPEPDAWVQ